jgi:putative ABC transport system permease protein
MVKAILLNPLPFKDAEKLVIIWEDAAFIGFPKNTPAPANYLDWKAQSKSFSQMAAVASGSYNLTGAGEAVKLAAFEVTYDFFPLLGVAPERGRVFKPEEDSPDAAPVAVLSHGLWQRQFAMDPKVVGKDILLNNKPYTVIGVMPASFQFLDPEIELWLPIAFTTAQRNNREGHYLQVVGRLKDDVSESQAQSEMSTIMTQIRKEHPDETGQLGVRAIPLRDEIVGDVRLQLFVLLSAVGLVLLIACANIANLLLSATSTRSTEIAVRAALGAGRLRIVRQLLLESLLLAITGGLLGTLLAYLSFRFLKYLIPPGVSLFTHLTLDFQILFYTAIISIVTGLIFGLTPAIRASKTNLSEALKSRGTRGGISDGKKFRSAMVIAETALAVVLLVAASLLIQTIYRLQTMDLGFNAKNVIRVETSLPQSKYDSVEKRAQFYDELLQRVEGLPDVVSAGYSTAVPLDWKGGTSGYAWEGRPQVRGEILDANHREVSTKLLQTLGIQLIAGRYFDGSETSTSMPVAIINEAMAETYSKTTSAIGKRFRISPDTPFFTVIGIVRSIRNMGLDVEQKSEMYFPLRQAAIYRFQWYAPKELLIRTKGQNQMKILPDVRKIVRGVDPEVPVSHVMTLESVVAREIQHRRITMILLACFALLALILASTGIYGVLSYFVNQQVPEIGVRLALGARPVGILLLVVRRGMTLATTGVLVGIIGSLALTRLLQSSLYGISAQDPKTISLTAALLGLAALAACIIPGRRAMKVEPLAALRYE